MHDNRDERLTSSPAGPVLVADGCCLPIEQQSPRRCARLWADRRAVLRELVRGHRRESPFPQPLVSDRGDGFNTVNVAPGSSSDPNPFFQALFSKPYLNQVSPLILCFLLVHLDMYADHA